METKLIDIAYKFKINSGIKTVQPLGDGFINDTFTVTSSNGKIKYLLQRKNKNIFKRIHELGYDGTLCMEHGKTQGGKEGDQKVINAYRACDSF